MPGPTTKNPRLLRRSFRNTSVATRLSLVVVLVALVSLVITSIVGLQRGGDLADGVLRERLDASGAARATQVELYLLGLERAVTVQALSPSTADAIADFSEAFDEIGPDELSNADESSVDQYYIEEVAPELSEVRDRPISAAGLIPQLPAAVYLQANYLVGTGVDRSLVEDAGDGSRWSELHDSLHQSLSEVVIQFGLDDLYLIEPVNHTIVYSTAKNIDFATSLRTGPHSGSALSVLINSFGDGPDGEAAIADFTSYTAAGGEPSAFVARPVITAGAVAGYVAFRFTPSRLNAIVTDDGSWDGEGETGQTYVVAQDGNMRSDARGFVEDQRSYVEEVRAAGAATDDQIRLMQLFGTTALFQPVGDTDAAFEAQNQPVETADHLRNDVLRSSRRIEIDGLDWAMIADVDQSEFEQPIVDFTRNLLVAIAVFLVVITFLAVRWSDRLLLPVRQISTRLRAVRSGADDNLVSSSTTLPDRSAAEFVTLADDIDTMLTTLRDRSAEADGRAAERRLLLGRLLPPQAARRAEAGESNVIDQVTQATIAVVVVRGLGPLLQSGSGEEARLLLDRFVDEADALARERGLERIRLTGDAYFAGCGTVRPLIDHAARVLAFVLDVRELLHDLGADASEPVSIGVGVDSGPVTVGLVGGSGLVYDAWGETVRRAAELAQQAPDETVLVSAATRAQLPATFEIDDFPSNQELDAFAVVGYLADPEPAR